MLDQCNLEGVSVRGVWGYVVRVRVTHLSYTHTDFVGFGKYILELYNVFLMFMSAVTIVNFFPDNDTTASSINES